jgi:hypothetical protein
MAITCTPMPGTMYFRSKGLTKEFLLVLARSTIALGSGVNWTMVLEQSEVAIVSLLRHGHVSFLSASL